MRAFLLVATLLFSQTVYSIGDREQGILYGIGLSWLWGEVTKEPEWTPGTVYSAESEFPPFRCSGDSIKCAYEKGVYEREREEWMDRKNKAYECGRYGRNCE